MTGKPLSFDSNLRRFDDMSQLIGNPDKPTSLVRLSRVIPDGACQLYLKLEWFSPSGSIKDRTALYQLQGLADRGELQGMELVEVSSGNTGIALAALAALKGIPITVTVRKCILHWSGCPERVFRQPAEVGTLLAISRFAPMLVFARSAFRRDRRCCAAVGRGARGEGQGSGVFRTPCWCLCEDAAEAVLSYGGQALMMRWADLFGSVSPGLPEVR